MQTTNICIEAIVCSRLCLRCATHDQFLQTFIVEHKFGGNYGCYARRILSPLRNRHDVPRGHIVLNMTSSTKPEVHNVYHNAAVAGPSHVHRQLTQTFDEVQSCGFRVMRADRQTYILITIPCTPLGGEVIIKGGPSAFTPFRRYCMLVKS